MADEGMPDPREIYKLEKARRPRPSATEEQIAEARKELERQIAEAQARATQFLKPRKKKAPSK